MTPGISIAPSQFVEGGAVPIDRNLTWTECRFALFDYTTKEGKVVATTTAGRIKYVDDDGTEFVQHYSVGDPERFQPSKDGKTLVAVGAAEALSKSSNFYLLMNALVNAGFPENKLIGDISVLDGLYTFNIGVPEPKRPGLKREVVEGARERVLSVPSQVHRLPWEKKGAKGAKPAAKGAKAEEGPSEDVTAKALELVGKVVDAAEGGKVDRRGIARALFGDKEFAKDPDKDAIARLLFTAAFSAELVAAGFVVDGEEVSRAG